MNKLVLIALLGLVLAAFAEDQYRYGSHKPFGKTNKQFLERQQQVLRLYDHVSQPNYYKEFVQIAESYSLESSLDNYQSAHYVKDFLRYHRNQNIAQDEPFNPMNKEQLTQAVALYKVFYYAKSYDAFYKTAVWARYYVNQGMYLYSLSVAILHRPDTYGIVLPAIYEVYPYYFYSNWVINKVQEHEQYRNFVKYSQGKYDESYRIRTNYSDSYYTLSEEQGPLSYYTEDVGINAYYYYYNLYRPFWLNHEDQYVNSYQSGEEYYYFYQQLVARYYLERQSNDLGEIPTFSFDQEIEVPFVSTLRYPNGISFPSRPDYVELWNARGYYKQDYESLVEYERRIKDSIDGGYIFFYNGTLGSIKGDDGFNYLGNILESNNCSYNQNYYGYLQIVARRLFGYHDYYQTTPSVLEQYETSQRDPIFYQLYNRFVTFFQKHKLLYADKYSYDDLAFPGVKVSGFQIDNLVTYFEDYDVDVSTAVRYSAENENVSVYVTQPRLNHKPFVYKINVESEKQVESVVRVFIGPQNGDFNKHRMHYVELDRFKYSLQSGSNVINRNSYQIYSGDYSGFNEIYNKVQAGLSGEDYYVYANEVHFTFPNRFALPKGNPAGQAYQFYVMVSPYHEYQPSEFQVKHQQQFWAEKQEVQKIDSDRKFIYPIVGLGVHYFDSFSLGYPFDRPIDNYIFNVPNAYHQDVKIYLKNYKEINTSS